MAAYVVRVLDAVGLRDGPAHTEVKWAPRLDHSSSSSGGGGGCSSGSSSSSSSGELEPCIIEVNARWHACNFRPVVEECVGCNAIDATALAILSRHHDLLRRAASSRRRKKRKTIMTRSRKARRRVRLRILPTPHTPAGTRSTRRQESAGDDGNGGKCGRVVHLVSFVEEHSGACRQPCSPSWRASRPWQRWS